jgi:hypothetical protein
LRCLRREVNIAPLQPYQYQAPRVNIRHLSNFLNATMDPGTVIAVLEILSSVVKSLIEAGQTIYDAPDGLFRVVRETEKLRVLMDRLLIFQRGLSKEQQDILDQQVSMRTAKTL